MHAALSRNRLSQGMGFHAQLIYAESFGWFFNHNKYLSGTNTVPPFFDPASSAAHVNY